jgi:hypothetical protein
MNEDGITKLVVLMGYAPFCVTAKILVIQETLKTDVVWENIVIELNESGNSVFLNVLHECSNIVLSQFMTFVQKLCLWSGCETRIMSYASYRHYIAIISQIKFSVKVALGVAHWFGNEVLHTLDSLPSSITVI